MFELTVRINFCVSAACIGSTFCALAQSFDRHLRKNSAMRFLFRGTRDWRMTTLTFPAFRIDFNLRRHSGRRGDLKPWAKCHLMKFFRSAF
jgi:hypothetical protein